ncbi:hypothetical protein [Actinopolymorpha pittospori]|uniref:Uncharacterized protein n=1 Tax=Actinopolymorpha pittospori TaxID=648752 RepID=A0A927N610_9ACTN|nr:hypothetical protein [Actinopolymorpha pittospori]MBE1612322.1 hypothetical protein [Actinopolymorpha pittospori]
MRFRLSLNVGPSRELPGVDSPVGKPMIDTHRLGDAEPLRLLLDHSDSEVTFLAAAISERVMEDVVRSGRSRLRESEFAAAAMDIPKKNFKSTAYLRVPKPSGDLLRLGLSGVVAMGQKQASAGGEPSDGGRDAHRADQPSPAPSHVHADRGGSAAGIGSVSGSGNTVAGRDIDQSQTTTTVHGSQYGAQGDMNFGTRSGRRVTAGGEAGAGSGRESS